MNTSYIATIIRNIDANFISNVCYTKFTPVSSWDNSYVRLPKDLKTRLRQSGISDHQYVGNGFSTNVRICSLIKYQNCSAKLVFLK